MSSKVAIIIGAGAFGTSIASVLAHNFDKVILKVRSQDIYDSINAHENNIYLPDQKLSENIFAALTWTELDKLAPIESVKLVVNGLPTGAINNFYSENQVRFIDYFKQTIPMVSLSKGIDPETLELPDDLFDRYFLEYKDHITFLSGPSFAKEIVES